MACWCQGWSSESSNVQSFDQCSRFWQLPFHPPPLAVFILLLLLGGPLHLRFLGQNVAQQEQSSAHSPQEGQWMLFHLLLTSLPQEGTLEVELGSLDSCFLERSE